MINLFSFRPLTGIKVCNSTLTKPVFMRVFKAVCGADFDFPDFITFSVILVFRIPDIQHGCHSGADYLKALKSYLYCIIF